MNRANKPNPFYNDKPTHVYRDTNMEDADTLPLVIDESAVDIPPPIKRANAMKRPAADTGAAKKKAYLDTKKDLTRVSASTYLKLEENQWGNDLAIHNIFYNPKKQDVTDFSVKVKMYHMKEFIRTAVSMWREKEPQQVSEFLQEALHDDMLNIL